MYVYHGIQTYIYITDPCAEVQLCAVPNCKPNEIAVTSPDECCPKCVPDLCHNIQ